MCERWVADWTNCNILIPSSFVFSSTSFSFCWAAQSGVLRVHSPLLGAGSLYSILSPTNWLQLTEPVCGTRLYNCLTTTCFLRASHLHPIQPVHSQGLYPDMFDRMHLFLDWRMGRRSICYKIYLRTKQKYEVLSDTTFSFVNFKTFSFSSLYKRLASISSRL